MASGKNVYLPSARDSSEIVGRRTNMTARKFTSADEYIGAQPESARAVLERVRAVVRKALPGADETISYNIPAYKLRGSAVIYFAAWKKHFSLYPASQKLIRFFKKDLAAATIRKSTIRFPLAEPVPARLIGRIVRFRVNELIERAQKSRSGSVLKGRQ
jgi:uncharacterized protein YdhG (YjbR/CyaY superfamily)